MADYCDLAIESAVLNDAITAGEIANLVEYGLLSDAIVDGGVSVNCVESAVLNDDTEQSFAPVNVVSDRLELDDHLITGVSDSVVETAVLNDATQQGHLDLAVERAVLNDTTKQHWHGVSYALETAVLNDTIPGFRVTNLAHEVAVLNDSVVDGRFMFDLAVEGAVLNDHLSGPFFDRAFEAFEINDAAVQTMTGFNNAVDQLVIYDYVTGGGPVNGVAWRTNLDTMPMSRYTNQSWNSMCAFGDKVLMASDLGLFERTGDTDDGVEIAARVEHDLLDRLVGRDGKPAVSPQIKRPRYAYLSYVSTSGLTFSLGHVTNTTEETATYDFPASKADQLTNGRVPLGRGIRSRFLRPAFENVAGGDFNTNDGTLIVDEILRRI